jgi:hypothetical protein
MLYENMFGLNTSAAEKLRNALAGGELENAKAVFEDPSSKGVDETPEGKLLAATEGIRADLANIGGNVISAKAGIVDAISRLTNIMAGDKKFMASSVETMDVLASIGLTGDRQANINKAFEKAYTAADQPDLDDNGKGDYAERAKRIQDEAKTLPKGIEYYTAMHPQNSVFSILDEFKDEEDFTEERTRYAVNRIRGFKNSKDIIGKSEDDFKREYLHDVASSVTEDKKSRKDDELRWLLTERPNLIPEEMITAFEEARAKNTRGGSSIDSTDYHGANSSEVSMIYNAIKAFAERIPELAKDLEDGAKLEVEFRDNSP